jgi:hypothetical protein
VFAAVAFAALVSGLRGTAVPFTGAVADPLGVAGEAHPVAAAGAVWQALTAHPALLTEAVLLAAAAAVLPRVARRSIAAFGVLLLAGMVAPDPVLPDAAIVATVTATCLGLAARTES